MQSLFGWAGKVLRVSQFTSTFEQLLFSPEKYTPKEFENINRKIRNCFPSFWDEVNSRNNENEENRDDVYSGD